jgi:hypothetical protein
MCANKASGRVSPLLQLSLNCHLASSYVLRRFELPANLLISPFHFLCLHNRNLSTRNYGDQEVWQTHPSYESGQQTRRRCREEMREEPEATAQTSPTHGSILRDAKGYLQRIYTAADQIYRRGRTKPRTLQIVNGIIIKVRCARVLTHLSRTGRAAYLAAIAKTMPSLDGRAQSHC